MFWIFLTYHILYHVCLMICIYIYIHTHDIISDVFQADLTSRFSHGVPTKWPSGSAWDLSDLSPNMSPLELVPLMDPYGSICSDME